MRARDEGEESAACAWLELHPFALSLRMKIKIKTRVVGGMAAGLFYVGQNNNTFVPFCVVLC
jgi:hypothetical protein